MPQHSERILHADDSNIFGILNGINELKTDLELIYQGMEKKLTANKGKTEIMINGIKKFESFIWNQNTIELQSAVKT